MKTRWFAVRCCCESSKIFGFLQLPDNTWAYRTITDRSGRGHKIELREACERIIENYRESSPAPIYQERSADLAVYSDDRPLEFWRQFDNFVETAQ